ncbi:MAG: hypothetical protein ACRD13_13340 [Terriglobales bacterium]
MAKEPTASEMGRLGGKARAKALSPAARRRIAQRAAKVRWAKAAPREKGDSK